METQAQTNPAILLDQTIKLVIHSWAARNTAVTNFFNKAENEIIYWNAVSPNRNRAVYLLGHLIATNDAMLPLLGFGEKLFPELSAFSSKPDTSFEINDTVAELKEKWETVNSKLTHHFNTLSAAEWLKKHMAVSAEDFEKEPGRNKLNVLLGRTNHQNYHLGQLNFLTF